jgi:hypothetical protein
MTNKYGSWITAAHYEIMQYRAQRKDVSKT